MSKYFCQTCNQLYAASPNDEARTCPACAKAEELSTIIPSRSEMPNACDRISASIHRIDADTSQGDIARIITMLASMQSWLQQQQRNLENALRSRKGPVNERRGVEAIMSDAEAASEPVLKLAR